MKNTYTAYAEACIEGLQPFSKLLLSLSQPETRITTNPFVNQ